MRVAVKFTPGYGRSIVDENGDVAGQDSGLFLVRRLLKLWDDTILIGDERRDCNGFELMRVGDLDVNRTVVISMDLFASLQMYVEMKLTERWHHPKMVNFAWFNVSEWSDPVHLGMLGLAVSRFPTFCNSSRTVPEFRSLVHRQISPAAARAAQMAFCPLGVKQLTWGDDRALNDVPVVRYPAMLLFARKQPDVFTSIMDRVRAAVDLKVEARLNPHQMKSPFAESWRWRDYMDVREIGSREEYHDELVRTDVFLATSKDESYGLAYVEQMQAGVIGVFPRRDWVWSIVPPEYPFVYSGQDEAVRMMVWVLRHLEQAREMVSGMPAWIREHHDEAAFGPAMVEAVRRWWMSD